MTVSDDCLDELTSNPLLHRLSLTLHEGSVTYLARLQESKQQGCLTITTVAFRSRDSLQQLCQGVHGLGRKFGVHWASTCRKSPTGFQLIDAVSM